MAIFAAFVFLALLLLSANELGTANAGNVDAALLPNIRYDQGLIEDSNISETAPYLPSPSSSGIQQQHWVYIPPAC